MMSTVKTGNQGHPLTGPATNSTGRLKAGRAPPAAANAGKKARHPPAHAADISKCEPSPPLLGGWPSHGDCLTGIVQKRLPTEFQYRWRPPASETYIRRLCQLYVQDGKSITLLREMIAAADSERKEAGELTGDGEETSSEDTLMDAVLNLRQINDRALLLMSPAGGAKMARGRIRPSRSAQELLEPLAAEASDLRAASGKVAAKATAVTAAEEAVTTAVAAAKAAAEAVAKAAADAATVGTAAVPPTGAQREAREVERPTSNGDRKPHDRNTDCHEDRTKGSVSSHPQQGAGSIPAGQGIKLGKESYVPGIKYAAGGMHASGTSVHSVVWKAQLHNTKPSNQRPTGPSIAGTDRKGYSTVSLTLYPSHSVPSLPALEHDRVKPAAKPVKPGSLCSKSDSAIGDVSVALGVTQLWGAAKCGAAAGILMDMDCAAKRPKGCIAKGPNGLGRVQVPVDSTPHGQAVNKTAGGDQAAFMLSVTATQHSLSTGKGGRQLEQFLTEMEKAKQRQLNKQQRAREEAAKQVELTIKPSQQTAQRDQGKEKAPSDNTRSTQRTDAKAEKESCKASSSSSTLVTKKSTDTIPGSSVNDKGGKDTCSSESSKERQAKLENPSNQSSSTDKPVAPSDKDTDLILHGEYMRLNAPLPLVPVDTDNKTTRALGGKHLPGKRHGKWPGSALRVAPLGYKAGNGTNGPAKHRRGGLPALKHPMKLALEPVVVESLVMKPTYNEVSQLELDNFERAVKRNILSDNDKPRRLDKKASRNYDVTRAKAAAVDAGPLEVQAQGVHSNHIAKQGKGAESHLPPQRYAKATGEPPLKEVLDTGTVESTHDPTDATHKSTRKPAHYGKTRHRPGAGASYAPRRDSTASSGTSDKLAASQKAMEKILGWAGMSEASEQAKQSLTTGQSHHKHRPYRSQQGPRKSADSGLGQFSMASDDPTSVPMFLPMSPAPIVDKIVQGYWKVQKDASQQAGHAQYHVKEFL
ncbi:uncharacterized protein LOC135818176 isoform X1 [Sycon ciliatum]|uniref:uncharacterized protein LOC135818176 isoform X1 n=1 Tax=Sycon ciliatum TaxID=27933 RepID=UPI0031F66752